MSEKMSYSDFLESYSNDQKKFNQMRNNNRPGGKPKGEFSKPKPFTMRMKYWRPGKDFSWVRFVPFSASEPFYEFHQVWTKVGGQSRSLICNCKGRQLKVPCVPCYYCTKEENPMLAPARKDAISVVVLDNFHKVKRRSKSGTEYSAYERCAGVDRYNKSICAECDDGNEKIYGNQYYWTLGYGHKLQLEEELRRIQESCLSCNKGEISTWGYACASCGEVMFSHKEQTATASEVEYLRNATDVVCSSCNHEGKLNALIECVKQDGYGSSATWVPGCDSPKPVTDVYGLDYLIRVTGTNNATSIEIGGWREPVNTSEIAKWKLEPMEFDYFLSHMDLDDQARAMGRENPFDESAQEMLSKHFLQVG